MLQIVLYILGICLPSYGLYEFIKEIDSIELAGQIAIPAVLGTVIIFGIVSFIKFIQSIGKEKQF